MGKLPFLGKAGVTNGESGVGTLRGPVMRLEGRVALVTGASRGRCRAIGLALGRVGASVALLARSRDELEEVSRRIGTDHSLVVPADLADLTQVRAAVETTVGQFGRIDVLVNNAALSSRRVGAHPQRVERRVPLLPPGSRRRRP